MQTIACLVSLVFVLPGILLAFAVDAVSTAQTQAQQSLLKAFGYVLDRMLNTLTWHLWSAVLLLLVLVVLAFVEKFRWCGAAVIAAGGLASLVYLMVKCRVPENVDQAIFLLPSLLGAGLALWVMFTSPHVPWR
jgi:hypothetical protein